MDVACAASPFLGSPDLESIPFSAPASLRYSDCAFVPINTFTFGHGVRIINNNVAKYNHS